MNKKDYIKVIEQMNKEYQEIYNCTTLKKKRTLKTILKLASKLQLKKLFYIFVRRKQSSIKISEPIYNKKSGKKVVYTCILNDYDNLMDPMVVTDNTDYIVFSDNKNIAKNSQIWKYRSIPKNIIVKCENNPVLINRYIKMHPKEFFGNYDLAMYIDGSIKIISDISDCFCYINDKTGLAVHNHRCRCDIYSEAKACISQNFGNKKKIRMAIEKYKKENFPENYGLFEVGIIAIDLNNVKSLKILNDWFEEFIKSGTLRDQMSFTYILWKNKFKYEDVGVMAVNISKNYKFRIYNHK